jgi:hypothetical protein
MTRRRTIALAGSALGVLLLLLAAAVLALPAERIAALAAARVSVALDREVQFGGTQIRLLPRPAVALTEVTIGGAPLSTAGADRPMAAAERVDLRPRLLPLLWRRIEIDALVLQRPSLLVEVDREGNSTLPTLTQVEDEPGRGFALEVRRIQVRDGQLLYRDLRDGTALRLSGVDQRLRLVGDTGPEGFRVDRLDGSLQVAALDLELPGRLAEPVRDLRVRLSHRAALDREADRIELQQFDLGVHDITLSGRGTVEHWSDAAARAVALELASGRFDVARLVRSLPAVTRGLAGLGEAERDAVRAGGGARLSASVNGRLGDGEMPDVRGRLSLERVSLAYGRAGRLIDELSGEVAFSLQDVSAAGLRGRLLGEPLQLGFTIQDFAAPQARLTVRSALDVARAARFGLLPEGWRGQGRMSVDVAASGPLLEPARARLDGRLGVGGVSLELATLHQPLWIETGELQLRGQELVARGLRGGFGSDAVVLDLALSDWLPYLLGASATLPELVFDARAQRFDADAALGYEPGPYGYGQLFLARLQGDRVDDRTVAEAAAEAGLGLPRSPALRLEGRLRANEVVKAGTRLRDVDLAVAGDGADLRVRSARLRFEQAGVRLVGRVGAAADVPAAGGLPLSLDFALEDTGGGEFIGRFSTLRGHLTGALGLHGTAHMQLDEHLLPLAESVTGEGEFRLHDGSLTNWPLLRALGRQLGIAQFDVLEVTAGRGQFRLDGPWIRFDEWIVEAGQLAAHVAGGFDLTGRLDLGLLAQLPLGWANAADNTAAGIVVRAAAGSDGRVPVGARVGGTFGNPAVQLDLTPTRQRLADGARQQAQSAARDLARRSARDLLERATPPPAAPAPAPTEEPVAGAAEPEPDRSAGAGDLLRRLRDVVEPRLEQQGI